MNIIIMGGTQGLGRALAQLYLEAGHDVCICGRDISKTATWRFRDAKNLTCFELDINNKEQLLCLFQRYQHTSIDLVINCAGIYINNRDCKLTGDETIQLLQTNVLALNQLFDLCAQTMITQGSGHIVALSSVAALIHYPGASLYSATKRSVINLCDTYRTALRPFNIKVTCVVPGYINTAQLRALNAGDASHKLFIIEEEVAASLIYKKLQQNKPLIVFPKRMYWLMMSLRCVPKALLNYFLAPKNKP